MICHPCWEEHDDSTQGEEPSQHSQLLRSSRHSPFCPVLSLAFAVAWASWWLLLSGIIAIYAAMQLRAIQVSRGWAATCGVLGVPASVSALVAPPATLAAILGLIAGFPIVSGVTLIIGGFTVRALLRPLAQQTGHAA
jgi:hypothetical protein